MTSVDRKHIRRAAIIAMHFMRNAYYYRAAFNESGKFKVTDSQFVLQANANFLDVAVLEWCKLFGSNSEAHHWKVLFNDHEAFKAEIEKETGIDSTRFQQIWKKMKEYRDETVAHMEAKEFYRTPVLDDAIQIARMFLIKLKSIDVDGSIFNGQLPDIDMATDVFRRDADAHYKKMS